MAVDAQIGGLEAEILARRSLPAHGLRRALREGAHLSLARIGRECGVSAVSVWRWENGEHEPHGRHVVAYARVLDLLRGDMSFDREHASRKREPDLGRAQGPRDDRRGLR